MANKIQSSFLKLCTVYALADYLKDCASSGKDGYWNTLYDLNTDTEINSEDLIEITKTLFKWAEDEINRREEENDD